MHTTRRSASVFAAAFMTAASLYAEVHFELNFAHATNFPGSGTTRSVELPATNSAAFYRVNTQ